MGEDTYVPCVECEGDGCHGPDPAEDQCKRCGGSGCEPSPPAPGRSLGRSGRE